MQLREDLRKCGHILSQKGLVWGHSGNISARVEPDTFLISASGSALGVLRDEDVVSCRIKEDAWEGGTPPSIEVGLHRNIYQACEDAAVVIHSQPFFSSLVACSDTVVRPDLLPETMAYLGKVARVPYHHAGSHELVEATAARARTSQVLLLENHGVVCWGQSLDEALLKTETLEFLCRLLVISRASGVSLNYLGEGVMEDFLQHLERIGEAA